MPRTHTLRVEDFKLPEIAEIQKRINEGGRVLAALIGKDFAGEIWTEVNRFYRVIDGNKLNNTGLTMITPEEQEVSDFAFAYFLSFCDY